MAEIDPDSLIDALRDCLRRSADRKADNGPPIQREDDLLELAERFEIARLIMDLEASLEVALPLDQIDVASIAKIDRLIAFIRQHR